MHSARIAILGIGIESNRFSPVTTLEDFKAFGLRWGEAVEELLSLGDAYGFGPAMSALRLWEPVPIVLADGAAGGPFDHEDYLAMVDEIDRRLAAAGPIDAVYIDAHGAGLTTQLDDLDGDYFRRVRRRVGDVPIVATLDLHGNISAAMTEAVDALISVRTNPHIDFAERRVDAAHLLHRMLAGERLHMARVRLPLITPQVTQLTDPGEPLGDLMAEAEAMIGGDIATVSLLPGFAFADVADNGFCVLAGAWSSKQAAEQAANGMAERVWASRRRFKRQLTSIEEGTAHASRASSEDSSKRVILADVADNPGGGGRGNTTDIMKALVEAEVEGAVVGVFIDPEVVSAAWRHGIGSTFEATFAADDPTPHSKPFTCYVRVLALSEGSFMCRRPPLEGYPFDLGRTCLLQAGTVQVAVATIRQQTFSADLLEHCGVDVEAAATFVVKSRGHFRAGFTDLVVPSNIFEIDGPGLAPPNLTRVEWRGLQRPIYPLEPDTEWSPLLEASAPV